MHGIASGQVFRGFDVIKVQNSAGTIFIDFELRSLAKLLLYSRSYHVTSGIA